MDNDKHSTRAAATALILGEIDGLLARVELLPSTLKEADAGLANSVAMLEAAADRYRMAITAFTDEAKNELTEYLQRKTSQECARGLDDFRAAMEASARAVMSYETAAAATQICGAVDRASALFKRSAHIRTLEAVGITVSSSLTTCLFWYWLGHFK